MSNTFYDINKFPKDWGIIVMPISMSNIAHNQSPVKSIKSVEHLMEKILVNKVGANFVYSEGLYMNFEKDSFDTKNKFANTAASHMMGVKKLILKNHKKFQIEEAFSFESWFQMYLGHSDFFSLLKRLRKIYDTDNDFQEYVKLDAKNQGRKLDERQLMFYLEEHLFTYLLINQRIRLRNDFVLDREKWVLEVYPGKPPLAQIYLVQKDLFNINKLSNNPYKGQYDSISKKFINYLDFNLEIVNAK